ncbi:DUF308 domain-containing protein [Bradyrhizobium sp.]|uniref:DUF308 domain-containing protein n=1 Tax=Bradyrhizobium sp. TaxID=376 RepID=UPI0039E3341E
MALALLIAGIFAVVAGLLAVLFGFTVREFSVGSTLIISGTIGVCSGMLLVGLHVVVVELKTIARRLAGASAPSEVRVRPVLPPGAVMPGSALPATPEPMAAPATRAEAATVAPPPWQDEAASRDRPRAEAPAQPEAPPPPAPEAPRRRNLLFASTSRKERERAQAKGTEGESSQAQDEPTESEAPFASFDDAWPKPDRMRPPDPPAPRRPPVRTPSTFAEAAPPPAPEPAPPAEQSPVTVLKSGVVDGMAYSLYSDGSIEAQMPEGMMRFASIDELRAHLDQRS